MFSYARSAHKLSDSFLRKSQKVLKDGWVSEKSRDTSSSRHILHSSLRYLGSFALICCKPKSVLSTCKSLQLSIENDTLKHTSLNSRRVVASREVPRSSEIAGKSFICCMSVTATSLFDPKRWCNSFSISASFSIGSAR